MTVSNQWIFTLNEQQEPGCQIQEAARPPYEAEIVPANKGETEEGEFHPPE